MALVLVTLSSCSTRRNTFTSRAYHNLVAHYNTYWNGNESFEQGLRELRSQSKPDYFEILPIEFYGTRQQAAGLTSYMDRAIDKSTKVIQKHSMTYARRERVKRVPDSYMLIGKANFYKQDYQNALKAFEFVAKTYEKQPISLEGQLWLARTFIQLGQFEKSIQSLDFIQEKIRRRNVSKNALKVPKNVIKELPQIYAWHFTGQENYNSSIPYLRKAIELAKDKKTQARINYIMGQIYQKQGNFAMANQYYRNVLKLKPPYELMLNTRMNMAQSFDANRTGGNTMMRDMTKMLKESKNKEYRDQIYYALGTVAMKQNNDSLAARMLKNSVASSINNDIQKAISALTLAELYFRMPNYQGAYAYYDTTLQLIQVEHPKYREIEQRTAVLSDLVKNLNVIKEQDSLQKLAAMPADQRDKIIDALIAKAKAEQKRLDEEQRAESSISQMGQFAYGYDPTMGIGGRMGSGDWYFYNTQTITFGIAQFQQKWGKRKLEDNWRLSDKRTYNFDFHENIAATPDTAISQQTEKPRIDPLNRDSYIRNIPLTPEQMLVSEKQVAEAMFKAGYIFRDQMTDYPRSVDAFEAFIKRFPGDEQELDALYHLYTLNTLLNNPDRATFYKNIIISRFTDSNYARILLDPNFESNLRAEQRRLTMLYQDTYQAFITNQHRLVVLYANEALKNYPKADLAPRFAFLKAAAMGQLHNQDSTVSHLRRLIATYPSSDVVPLAQEALGFLGIEGFDAVANSTEEPQDLSLIKYSQDFSSNHIFAILLDAAQVNMEATRVKILDFHNKFYPTQNLSINTTSFDPPLQMLTVSSFAGREKAMEYFNRIIADNYAFSHIKRENYSAFIINADNFALLIGDKDKETYLRFFDKYYTKNTNR